MKRLFVLLFLFPSLSFASSGGDWYEKGNGGFVVMCDKEALMVFDLFEAQVRYKMIFDGQALGTLDERVEYLLTKFDKHNKSRAALYRRWYKEFFNEAEFIPNAKFNPTGDIGFGYIPKNCSLEQVIFQRAPNILNQFRYLINLDLWQALSIENQAALVMHELIYRELTLPPNIHESSEAARYFNALLNSEQFQKLSYQQYILTLQELRFSKADYGDLVIVVGEKKLEGGWYKIPVDFFDRDHLKSATLDNVQNFKRGKFVYDSRCAAEAIDIGTVASFFPQGQIRLLAVRQTFPDLCGLPYFDYENAETKLRLHGTRWSFNETGQLITLAGNYNVNSEVQIAFNLKGIKFEFGAQPQTIIPVLFDFDDNERISEFMLGTSACFDPAEKTVRMNATTIGSSIFFNYEGLEQEVEALEVCLIP
ncbi:hypothetical protein [Bdellovibrio sp. HCB-162]|uniref:hypothetical protein n=1 Tax=Bdellovibrio sp. HCB-162 TaxID=3394234 RepID=UPI0039BC8853